MSEDERGRVFIARDGEGTVVMQCGGCGDQQPLDPMDSVVEQLLTFLDHHGHSD